MTVVDVQTKGEIALIALDRPDKLNAINAEMLDGLLEAVEDIGGSETIGAAVLTGRGRAFSTGGDITAMSGMDEGEFAATIARYMQRLGRVPGMSASRSLPRSTATLWPAGSSSR